MCKYCMLEYGFPFFLKMFYKHVTEMYSGLYMRKDGLGNKNMHRALDVPYDL